MRNFMRVAVSVLAVVIFSASAVAKCVPRPPKDVEGHIEFIPLVRQSITANYYEHNGCDWGDAQELNGLDAVVLDVKGITGRASITAIVHTLSATPMEAVFLSAKCARMGDPVVFGQSVESAPQAFPIKIPKNAKWTLVQGSTEPPAGSLSGDIDVKLHSDGKKCPKKKKRRR